MIKPLIDRKSIPLMAAAVLMSGLCHAQGTPPPFQFFVTVNSSPSCTFQGVSYSTQLADTLTNGEVAAKHNFSDLSVTRNSDFCTPTLQALVATGTQIPSVVMSVQATVNGSLRELQRLTFSGVTATALLSSPPSHEVVRFSYSSIKIRWLDGTEMSKSKQ